jgi:type I restriction enzyme, S subunit
MMQIPSDWERVSLHKIAYIQTGIAKGSKDVKDPVYLPYLRVANVQDGYLDLSEIKEIEIDRRDIERYLLQDQDVLLTEGGDFDKLGRGTIWRNQISPCVHQNHVFAVRLDQNVILPYFFAQQTASPYGKQYFLSIAKQTTNLASINKGQLSEFPVLLPPLSEQRKIAEILSTWDEAIALTERLIDALKQRKQALMQLLLTGQVRFPEFGGETWETVRLGDVFERVTRKNKVGNQNALTISAQQGLVSQSEYFNRTVTGADITKYYLIERGEFAYNRSYSAGYPFGALKRLDFYDAGILSTLYICFRLMDEQASSDYFATFFDSGGLDRPISEVVQEGARNHGLLNIALEDFFNIQFDMPPYQEQHKIAEVANALNELISEMHKYRKALQTQKRGLMQRLLTGQVRVNVEE